MAALRLVHGGTRNYNAHKNSHLWLRRGNGPLLLPFNSRYTLHTKLYGTKRSVKSSLLCRAEAADIASSDANPKQLTSLKAGLNSAVLDIEGMMCGSCVARVRNLLLSDPRVESAAVNMVTEMAAIQLKSDAGLLDITAVTEELARRLTDCGFPSRKREKGSDIGSNTRKWQEMLKKKEESLRRSRNRVAFAWTLVALCCGTHGAHLLHSVGIHVAHGSAWGILENAYIKCGTALAALLGPGRELEKRVGMHLEQATLSDLLIPSYSNGKALYDVDVVQRVLEHFLTKEVTEPYYNLTLFGKEKAGFKGLPSVHAAMPSAKMSVARLVDSYLAEIARDTNLLMIKFQALADALLLDCRMAFVQASYSHHLDQSLGTRQSLLRVPICTIKA